MASPLALIAGPDPQSPKREAPFRHNQLPIRQKTVSLSVESPTRTLVMPHYARTTNEESVIRMKGKFCLASNQVVYFDPNHTSEFSLYIESHLDEIKEWFDEYDYEFCYVPDICRQITTEQIQYLFPNWKKGTAETLGNDFIKSWLHKNNSTIGAGFLRLDDGLKKTCKFYPLVPFATKSWEEQLSQYKQFLLDRYNEFDHICFSISEPGEGDGLYSVYEKKLSLADNKFSEEEISAEIRRIVEQLHKEGFEEFVMRCMVPVEEKLSRITITPRYEILLPDYDNKIIDMSPLPKAVFLLFLKHPEGIYFKDLVDYKEELRGIYEKITNRTSASVVGDSIDKVTDPTQNAINEKCSRIREAFIQHMDKRLAENYYITGFRSERKRITLPRHMVDWQCVV